MMKRILIMTAAVASAVLAQAPAAHAEPICVDVGITGSITINPNAICVPYFDETTCAGLMQGTPNTVYVSLDVCFPALIGSGGGL